MNSGSGCFPMAACRDTKRGKSPKSFDTSLTPRRFRLAALENHHLGEAAEANRPWPPRGDPRIWVLRDAWVDIQWFSMMYHGDIRNHICIYIYIYIYIWILWFIHAIYIYIYVFIIMHECYGIYMMYDIYIYTYIYMMMNQDTLCMYIYIMII